MGKVQLDVMKLADEQTEEDRIYSVKRYSERAELLRSRADILTGRDRVMMRMYLDSGATFSQIARLAGVNEVTIARRITRLTERLLSGDYVKCLRRRDLLSPLEIGIAEDSLVTGLSQRKVAAKRKISIYSVRVSMRKIGSIVRGI